MEKFIEYLVICIMAIAFSWMILDGLDHQAVIEEQAIANWLRDNPDCFTDTCVQCIDCTKTKEE